MSEKSISFNYLENARYEYLDSKDTQEILLKWYINRIYSMLHILILEY